MTYKCFINYTFYRFLNKLQWKKSLCNTPKPLDSNPDSCYTNGEKNCIWAIHKNTHQNFIYNIHKSSFKSSYTIWKHKCLTRCPLCKFTLSCFSCTYITSYIYSIYVQYIPPAFPAELLYIRNQYESLCVWGKCISKW